MPHAFARDENLSYPALDLHVIRGRADAVAVTSASGALDYARLITETAALAGAMRALGTTPGASVLIDLDEPLDVLLAFLAAQRLNAVPVLVDPAAGVSAATLAVRHRPHLIVSARPWPGHVHRPEAVLYRGPEPQDAAHEVDWEVALRAGRTDPAPAPPRAVAEQAEPGESAAYVVGERAVLHGEVPETSTHVGAALAALIAGEPGADLTGWSAGAPTGR